MREARGKPLPGRAFLQVPTRPCLCAEVQGRAPGGRRAGTQMPGPPTPRHPPPTLAGGPAAPRTGSGSRPLVAGALAVFSAIPQPSAPLTDSCLRPPVSRKAGTHVALVETPQPGLHTQGRWYSFKLRSTDPIPDSGLAVPAENRSSMIDRYRNTGRLCHKRDKNVNYLCTWRPVLPDSGQHC